MEGYGFLSRSSAFSGLIQILPLRPKTYVFSSFKTVTNLFFVPFLGF